MTIYTLCGLAGCGVALGSYFATLRGWLRPETVWFPATSLLATVLIAMSLITQWNITTAVMQIMFGCVGIYGLVERLRKKIA